jgi:glycosyltransferase involved in cell wall biosynthesis
VSLPTPPSIAPVPQGKERPFWSVMIPTYNATDLLEMTLRSVLDQDPGPDRMEIVVVDDCSPNGNAEEIVRSLASDRVRFHRGEVNVGLAGNWNRCVALSRGRWVHILHQDDLVQPGFYERLSRADQAEPRPGAAFCQHAFIDAAGNWQLISSLERRSPGLIEDWLERIVDYQRVQCPSIVVRRDVYEHLGGYLPDLIYALDWEMWIRIALHYPVWYEPTVLACWRRHDKSETARLLKLGTAYTDVEKTISLIKKSGLPPAARRVAGRGIIWMIRDELITTAYERMTAGDYLAGMASINAACRYDWTLRFSKTFRSYAKWALKLRLRDLLGRVRRPAPTS